MQIIRINILIKKLHYPQKMNIKALSVALVLMLCCANSNANDTKNSPENAKRIISAGGSITEILYALGLEQHLVGIDNTSFYPEETKLVPKIGYFRNLSTEGLMSLNPDLVVAAKGAGPDVVLKQLESLGVEVRSYEQSIYDLNTWENLITSLGKDFTRDVEAQNLIVKTNNSLAKIGREYGNQNRPINAVTLLSIGQRGPVAAGSNTVPNFLFKLANINNIAESIEGYKPFSSELLAKEKLDIVFIPSHVVDSLGGKKAVCDNPILKMAMPKKCNVHVMDGLLLMGFGSRIDQAAKEVAEQANKIPRQSSQALLTQKRSD
jgi:iron complex transport system substrate-binding protein